MFTFFDPTDVTAYPTIFPVAEIATMLSGEMTRRYGSAILEDREVRSWICETAFSTFEAVIGALEHLYTSTPKELLPTFTDDVSLRIYADDQFKMVFDRAVHNGLRFCAKHCSDHLPLMG